MIKPRILIEIKGGDVLYIAASSDMDILLIDYDNLECGNVFDGTPLEPDRIQTVNELNEYAEEQTKQFKNNGK